MNLLIQIFLETEEMTPQKYINKTKRLKRITQNIVMTFKETKCLVKNLPPTYTLGLDGFVSEFLIKLSKG